jgi:hypothetical protein
VQPSQRELAFCQAEIDLEYWQSDAVVRVTGEIENVSCPASGGEYTLEVRVRDDTGETQTFEIDETWHAEDDGAVTFTADYWIGESVELVRVRTRRLRCACTDPP